jgi:hypothetical protein
MNYPTFPKFENFEEVNSEILIHPGNHCRVGRRYYKNEFYKYLIYALVSR